MSLFQLLDEGRLTSSDSSILPEDMANQSVRLKEEQLRREEEKLREIELKVQREIQVKRQELLAKEDSLKVLEARLGESFSVSRAARANDSPTKHRAGLSTSHHALPCTKLPYGLDSSYVHVRYTFLTSRPALAPSSVCLRCPA